MHTLGFVSLAMLRPHLLCLLIVRTEFAVSVEQGTMIAYFSIIAKAYNDVGTCHDAQGL